MTTGRVTVVAALGTTQTIAWASSYYMPAILGAPIASALHLPRSVFFGLFSGALLLSAVVGPTVGRLIDRHGGRHMLAASNLFIAAGLLILAAAHSLAGLVIAWTALGVGIGMGLYDPAFATLTWLYGRDARSSITGITLIAGFASTIGWPLTAVLLQPLRFTNPSPPSGWVEDFHLRAIERARHTTDPLSRDESALRSVRFGRGYER